MVFTRATASTATSQLVDLPIELRVLILDNLNPFDLLSAALTCHALKESAQDRLSKQAELRAKFHLQHDRPPKAMLELLRKASANDVASRDAAWHIRDLELWDTRLEWTDWKTYEWCCRFNEDTEEEEPLEPVEDYSDQQEDIMGAGEMDEYATMFESDFGLTAEESSKWIDLMHQGREETIKGLVIALAPRLRSVKFVQYDSWQSDDRPHPMELLCTMIDRCSALPQHQWPIGFQTLQYVSVCASTSMRHPHDMYYCEITEVAPLFKLPNLTTLHLAMINASSDRDQTFPELNIPARCSAIRHLGLYLPQFDPETLERVMAASRNLESLTWTSEGAETINKILQHLKKYQHSTIRKLHLPVRSIEQDNPYPAHLLQLPLREIIDFPLTAILERPDSSSTEEWPKESQEWFNTATVIDLREVFPETLEKISIRAHSSRGYGRPYSESREPDKVHSKSLFPRLLELVQDPRFKNLKEICCDSVFCEPSFDMTLLTPFANLDVDVHRPQEQPGEWDGEGYESWHLGTLDANFSRHEADVHGLSSNLDIMATDPRAPEDRN